MVADPTNPAEHMDEVTLETVAVTVMNPKFKHAAGHP
jgi:hypothetical protein